MMRLIVLSKHPAALSVFILTMTGVIMIGRHRKRSATP
ncbi:hypothetical protein Z949_2665 [Sulfitobacter guttiformis KCTC 32187]|nr:hypothetical protein Z949_2665 [Sulfitobacter guttiformis KCTC 32187]